MSSVVMLVARDAALDIIEELGDQLVENDILIRLVSREYLEKVIKISSNEFMGNDLCGND